MRLGFVGSTAMPLIRPVAEAPPGAWPFVSGAGPICVQVKPFSGIEADGTVLSSNNSTLRRTRGWLFGAMTRRRENRERTQLLDDGLLMTQIPGWTMNFLGAAARLRAGSE